ncbi:MAG: cytidine deaminase [Verrucomicrobiota bacterium]|nr:cytidine deaminase [Verrucomicrobiota bacterium]
MLETHPSDEAAVQKLALEARSRAYAPYSQFPVGAALVGASGRVFCGCNVENVSFGLTVCAERNAVAAAVAAGEREFTLLVVVADSREPVTPCGACRQVLAEFQEALTICSFNLEGREYRTDLRSLLPRPKTGILDRECST